VVLVDHGSTTPVAQLLPTPSDPRVRVIVVAREVPFASALEVGRAACAGAWVARMDADDVMHPDRLRSDLTALAADPGLGAVACRVKVLPRGSLRMHGYVAWQNSVLDADAHQREIWIEQPVCHPATTFRASALVAVGGYRAGPWPEDYDLFLRLSCAGHKIKKRAAVQHGWRQHEQMATRTAPTQSRDALATLKATHAVAHFGLHACSVAVLGAGKEGRRFSRALRAVGHAGPAFFIDVDPKKQTRLVHGVAVRAPAALAVAKGLDPGLFVVAAVGTSGARGAVRALLAEAGFVEGDDAIVVA
jgi:hypothetical protein